MSRAAELPDDVEALKGLVRERSTALEVAEALCISQKLELEKLRFEIACLKRARYGRSSEQLDQQLMQMQLSPVAARTVAAHCGRSAKMSAR
jgi:transposase